MQENPTQPGRLAQLLDPLQNPTLTIAEVMEILPLGRTAAYEAVKRGDIPTVRLGRRLVVPTAALRRMLSLDGPAIAEAS